MTYIALLMYDPLKPAASATRISPTILITLSHFIRILYYNITDSLPTLHLNHSRHDCNHHVFVFIPYRQVRIKTCFPCDCIYISSSIILIIRCPRGNYLADGIITIPTDIPTENDKARTYSPFHRNELFKCWVSRIFHLSLPNIPHADV